MLAEVTADGRLYLKTSDFDEDKALRPMRLSIPSDFFELNFLCRAAVRRLSSFRNSSGTFLRR